MTSSHYILGKIKSTITFTGIENAQEKADLLNSRGTDLSTESVEFKYAEKGSLVLYVEIGIALLQDGRLLNREMESFIQRVFAVADLQCFSQKHCDVFFSILEGMLLFSISITREKSKMSCVNWDIYRYSIHSLILCFSYCR